MTLDSANVIPQALWAEACSTAKHIKNRLLHSAIKLKNSPYRIMFGDKPLVQHLNPFGAKCYRHVPEEK
jgi:hypothetical protein